MDESDALLLEIQLRTQEAVIKGVIASLPEKERERTCASIQTYLAGQRANAATLKAKYPGQMPPQRIAEAIEEETQRWLRILEKPNAK